MTDPTAIASENVPVLSAEEEAEMRAGKWDLWTDDDVLAERIRIENEAMQTVARIVMAAGGDVRVPDRYDLLDWSVYREPVDNATVYRARLATIPDDGPADPEEGRG